MEIKLVNRGETAELILSGRLDANTADDTLNICNQVSDRFLNVILNMAQLQYISSAGLRVLKLLYMKINKAGGTLEITNAAPMVMEVFEMTGFASFLKII